MTNETPDLRDNKHRVFVEWSKEDKAFIGHCPALMISCNHGDDEVEVYKEVYELLEYDIKEGCTIWTEYGPYLQYQPTKWVDWDKDKSKYIGKYFYEGQEGELCRGDDRVDVYKELCKKYGKQVVSNKCFEFSKP